MENRDLILALNSGSSSLKFGLYAAGEGDELPVLTGSATGIGRDDGALHIRAADGASLVQRECIHESQLQALTTLATEIRNHFHGGPIAVGHRVVHGGPQLVSHQRITPHVLEQLQAATHFAPLHIPQALALIALAQSIFTDAEHFACFDNVFHQTLPEVAYHLALPRRYFDAGVRRYGFHGLSYASLVHHFGATLPGRAIFAHLGNGASLCAVRNGQSIDTTMGMTPTGGIPMGTRSGDLDPGALLFLLRNEITNTDELEEVLNHASGLFALSDGESDMKTLENRARANEAKAALAVDVFTTSIRKVIGGYIALMGGVDLIVFTGGIGEHSELVRSAATRGLEALGVSPATIQTVTADEERQIARHCRAMAQQQPV